MRLASLVLPILILLPSFSGACEIVGLIQNRPDLGADFYDRYAAVKAINNDRQRARAREALIREYNLRDGNTGSVASSTTTAANQALRYPVVIGNKAKKSYRRTRGDAANFAKVNEFVSLSQKGFAHISQLARERGWNMEVLRGTSDYSVRMNSSFRIVFRKTEGGGVEIVDMGNQAYRHD